MPYIKKLVMKGFKSFAQKTELPFTPGINVILGPNGSGKSNVSDALCFVLGRLSIKSMRAAKASNLVFLGGKGIAPSKEAVVEIIFDNSDNTFSIEDDELSIKRIVRKNGQSIYKINNQTKTRQEVLTILAQAGIDPNGFNIILQGEIQNFVKLQPEERRKVIEEVAGISIYESRKEKSLRELEKTEEKLKEVNAILKERNSYLNNLEKEREEALKAQKLKEDVKKLKKSILNHDLEKKKKEIESTKKEIENKLKESETRKNEVIKLSSSIKSLENKITEINSTIQKSTGLEQERLNNEIANIRAEIAGLTVKIENHTRKISSIEKQKKELENSTREIEEEIKTLQKESPTIKKIQKELEIKKKALENIEEQRKKYYMSKSELRTILERIEEKKQTLQSNKNESSFLLKQIDGLSIEIFDKKASAEKLDQLKLELSEKKQFLENLNLKEKEFEKIINTSEYEISEQNKIIDKISRMDICPLCKSHITENHIEHINKESSPKINELKKRIESAEKNLNDLYNKRDLLKQDIESLENQISKAGSDIIKLRNIEDKTSQMKSLQEKIEILSKELDHLEKRRVVLEERFDENLNIEEKYERLKIDVQEISLRNHENLDSEVSFKQREFERMKISYKQLIREEEEISEELIEMKKNLSNKQINLDKNKKQEEILTQKFQKLIGERDHHQYEIRKKDNELSKLKNSIYNLEQEINNFKIDQARISAEMENLETEILEFPDLEIIKGSRESLSERFAKTQHRLDNLGSVNMRALEVYDEIKKEYDSIKEKVETIGKEKQVVLKIIAEIDIKKKKVFLKTLEELNIIFSRNFAQISTKGEVYLDLENKKSPFEAGVNVVIKTGHGKYFDIKSLSGGEQTMVALSLIFAIQELKPYCFYILDEIDAALDKRNSERLANLLKKYMQKGQYIVISHNDEIITNATNLYGISMHSGVSKVVSLRV